MRKVSADVSPSSSLPRGDREPDLFAFVLLNYSDGADNSTRSSKFPHSFQQLTEAIDGKRDPLRCGHEGILVVENVLSNMYGATRTVRLSEHPNFRCSIDSQACRQEVVGGCSHPSALAIQRHNAKIY